MRWMQGRDSVNNRKLNTALFMAYGALMLWLLFDRPGYVEGIPYWEQVEAHLNLVPLRTLRLFADLLDSSRPDYVRAAVVNLFGNIIMFIPLGFLLPRVFPKLRRLYRVLLVTALVITAVEIAQLFTLVGSCDIDDLILNVIGAAMGYLLHKHI